MDMSERLKLLRSVIGEEFVEIDPQNFKSENGDAIVLHDDELHDFVKERIKEEIPFLSNELLKKYLPQKFQNDFFLDEYKNLSKYDHTLLSNLISDEILFGWDVTNTVPINDLVMIDSDVTYTNKHWVFYLKHK